MHSLCMSPESRNMTLVAQRKELLRMVTCSLGLYGSVSPAWWRLKEVKEQTGVVINRFLSTYLCSGGEYFIDGSDQASDLLRNINYS